MMFKYIYMAPLLVGMLLGAGTVVFASPSVEPHNQALQLSEYKPEDNRSVIEEGGDMLLLYPDTVTPQVLENIEFLADTATCLDKKLVFVNASEAEGHLSDYPYVVCYALTEHETGILQELSEYEGEVCILGGDFLQAYLNLPDTKEEVSGIFQYSFDDIEWFETTVNLETVLRLPEEKLIYQRGRILLRDETIPFFSQIEGITYCPVTDFSSPLLQEAALRELGLWQWPYLDKPPSYAQYLVLDQIYPFMPAQELLKWVQTCIDSGVPFVMNVMPIYQNEEFPAMQQFCEVLKYAQANGGAIILHAPILHREVEDDAFRSAVAKAILAYTDRGVYPLGLAVPRDWIWDQQKLEFMQRYKTVFVYETDENEVFDLSLQTNLIWQNNHQLVMPARTLDGTGISHLTSCPSAIYVDVRQEIRDLEYTLKNLLTSFVPMKSLWDMDHSVWAEQFHLDCTGGRIKINGQSRSLRYQPEEYPYNFTYNRNTLQRITVSLKSQNQKLLIAGTIATVIFLGMIVAARITVIHYFRRRNKLPEKRKMPSDKKGRK